MTPAEHEIHAAHTAWIAAVNAGDLARLLTLVTDDLVLISPGQVPTGREGFATVFSDALQKLRFHCVSELEEAVVVGEVAYTRCRDTLTATPLTGGAELHLAGHRMTVYRRQPDGRWLLARDMHTLAPVSK